MVALIDALADGRLALHAGCDWDRARQLLVELPGIGPWTAEVIAMRGLGDPDAFPATDLGVRLAAKRWGCRKTPVLLRSAALAGARGGPTPPNTCGPPSTTPSMPGRKKGEMMSALQYRTIESPVGPLTLAGNGRRVMHLWMVDQTHGPSRRLGAQRQAFSDAVDQLDAYFAGERREFDLELDLVGTNFQRRVWEALLTIPYGETRSYGDIAEQIGSPGAFRAVGLANGRNPIRIIVSMSSGNRCQWQPHRVWRRAGAQEILLEFERSREPVTMADGRLVKVTVYRFEQDVGGLHQP